MSTNPIDFSSIGGKPVTAAIDFSSVGGKPVAQPGWLQAQRETALKNMAAQAPALDKFQANDGGMAGRYATGSNPATRFIPDAIENEQNIGNALKQRFTGGPKYTSDPRAALANAQQNSRQELESVSQNGPVNQVSAILGSNPGSTLSNVANMALVGKTVGKVLPTPPVDVNIPSLSQMLKMPPATILALLKAGADRVFAPGTPNELMVRAIRPGVASPDLETAMANQMGNVYQAGETAGAPVNNLPNYKAAVEAVKTNADTAYAQTINPYRRPMAMKDGNLVPAAGPYQPVNIDTTPVADAQMRSIPATDILEKPNAQTSKVVPVTQTTTIEGQPVTQKFGKVVTTGDEGIVAKTAEKANLYRREMPIGQADAIRVDTNAKLDAFWEKNAGDKHAARSNPEVARTEAVNNTIRDLVYDELKNRTGVDVRPIQKTFGETSEIDNAANKRGVVYGRQNPTSLAEELGAAEKGVRGFITAKMLKTYKNPSTLIRIAYERWASENGITPSWKQSTPSLPTVLKMSPADAWGALGSTPRGDE